MKLKSFIAASAAVIFLGACTVEVKDSTPATAAPVKTTPTQPAYSDEDLYLESIQTEYPGVLSVFNRSDLIELGKTMCQAIDEGVTVEGMVAIFTSEGFTDMEFMGTIAGSAIYFFCPENGWWANSAA